MLSAARRVVFQLATLPVACTGFEILFWSDAMSKLGQFLNERLKVTDALHEDDERCPPWWEERTTVEIKKQTYYEKLDLLPPRYMDGNLFAFGEGAGSFSIFWSQTGRFYVHHLTQADTETFCQLVGLALV